MYLVKTTNGDKILNSADAVKSIKKLKVCWKI